MNTILQIRLSLPNFASGVSFVDPVIIERAENVSLVKTVSSSDETITFEMPLNDPKMQYVTYIRWWECWDTDTNVRLNYGPITAISYTSGQTKKISGPGRSALLEEFYKSTQTFYYPINQFFDDLRYENIAGEPRTSTIINKATSSDYYGLSLRTKDFAIDEQTGFISIGRDTPERGTKKSDAFWTGIDKADYLTVNLGDKYTISKALVLLPWWGGPTVWNTRTYEWDWSHSDSPDSGFTTDFTTVGPHDGAWMDPAIGGTPIYYGGETGFDNHQIAVDGDAVEAQYWKVNIRDAHAWYGNALAGVSSDEWGWECGESNVLFGNSAISPTVSGGIIPKTDLNPSSNCHASVVELGVYRKILGRDNIPNLAYHQIQDDNRQITYYHVPDASEMISAGSGTKFEPGGFFRRVTYTSGGGNIVKSEFNNILYTGGSYTLSCPAYSRLLLFSDASTQVTQADAWISTVDAFSYGGSYSHTIVQNDTAVLHFRGVSLKWFATIPEGSTAGRVSIELRSKDGAGIWTDWDTLEAGLTLPVGVSAEKVYEITYESALLQDDTNYELKITNLNGGYVSIDAFAGYWSASFSEINEDDNRFGIAALTEATQLFNSADSFGSVYEFKDVGHVAKMGFTFTGDRIIVYAKKGPNSGKIQVFLWNPFGPGTYPIPGGEADGSLIVDLQSAYEVPQVVIFDSNDFFTDTGLPWAHHQLYIWKPDDTAPMYVDGLGVHETSGLSVKFVNTTHLEILKNTCEALQLEWDVTENGILVVPRIGTDTDVIFAEGRGTTISIQDDEDSSQVATMLISSGSDIDGLPLTTVVENKVTRKLFGRTIQRLYDFRNIGDYFTLIGASRAELLKRRTPQKKIIVTYAPGPLPVNLGDSFIVKNTDLEVRVRAITITRNQSSSAGTDYSMECITWPQII